MARRECFTVRVACVIVGVLVLVIGVSTTSPAYAAGTPYSPFDWAGVRSWSWQPEPRPPGDPNLPDQWSPPRRAKADWTIQCLRPTLDGDYGAYDQWIGIESSNGQDLIQVGVRAAHLDMGMDQPSNQYFAWVVNTQNPMLRTPIAGELFPIDNHCASGDTHAEVHAEVNANGRVQIWVDDRYRPPFDSRFAITSPRFASFILQRWAPNESMPRFGTDDGRRETYDNPAFKDCYVGGDDALVKIGAGTDGRDGSVPQTKSARRDMTSLIQPPPWSARWPAVLTSDLDIYGNFRFAQFLLM